MKYHLKHFANRIAQTLGVREPFQLRFWERLENLSIVAEDRAAAYDQVAVSSGPRVLLFNPIGYAFQTRVTAILAHALALRGAKATALICDAAVPKCERRAVTRDGIAVCRECIRANRTVFDALGVPYRMLSEFVTPQMRETAKQFACSASVESLWSTGVDTLPVGGMARAGTLRYFFQSELDLDDEQQELVAREFLMASATIANACPIIFDALSPDRVVMVDGVYTYTGLYSHYARKQGIPTYVWNRGYRVNTITMSLGGNESEVLHKVADETWFVNGLSNEDEHELDEYLESRKTNENDFRVFVDQPVLDTQAVAEQLGLQRDKTTVGIFTNVAWDVAVLADDVPFQSMDDWLIATIQELAKQDVQILLRVHPYEADPWNRTRFGVEAVLQREFKKLPQNLKVIPPESKLSSYALIPYLDGAAVFSSKIGMELACLSVPVLTGGVALYRGHGFTLDPTSRQEYLTWIASLASQGPLAEEKVRRARSFAHFYFFRHYIPMRALAGPSETSLGIAGLCDLLPGRDADLDRLCDNILEGQDCCSRGRGQV